MGRWSRLWSYTLPSFPAYYLNMEKQKIKEILIKWANGTLFKPKTN